MLADIDRTLRGRRRRYSNRLTETMTKQLQLNQTSSGESGGRARWGDEFDLHDYFAGIKPGDYVLQDDRELEAAQRLFSTVQECVVRWVGFYREVLKTFPRHPGVLSPVARCLRCVFTEEFADYVNWFRSSHKTFRGKTPEGWFRHRNLDALELYLRFDGSAIGQTDKLRNSSGVVPKTTYSGPIFHMKGLTAVDQVLLGMEDRIRLHVIRICFSFELLHNEFDLAPYYLRWSPVHYLRDTPKAVLSGLEIFDAVYTELRGWIHIYCRTLGIACRRSGMVDGIAQCAAKLANVGWASFLAWYGAPQDEVFNGQSPREWFYGKEPRTFRELLPFNCLARNELNLSDN